MTKAVAEHENVEEQHEQDQQQQLQGDSSGSRQQAAAGAAAAAAGREHAAARLYRYQALSANSQVVVFLLRAELAPLEQAWSRTPQHQ